MTIAVDLGHKATKQTNKVPKSEVVAHIVLLIMLYVLQHNLFFNIFVPDYAQF